jgi:dephospho-CoA kinase
MKLPKLLILGNARHGKDTLAEILNKWFGYTFQSSSQSAADIFIYEELKDKYNYSNSIECFEDRVNHRQEWYEMICDYNKYDKAKLAKEILKTSDCYVGMRDRDEIKASIDQGLFDLIVWVDASERLPLEDASSFNIDRSVADIIIENNGSLKEFEEKVLRLGKILMSSNPSDIALVTVSSEVTG